MAPVRTQRPAHHINSGEIRIRRMRVSTVHAVIRGSIGIVALVTVVGVVMTHAEAIHADISECFAVAIRLHVDSSLTPRRMTERVKAETEAIWGPYGVRLEWTDAEVLESADNRMFLDASVERGFERRQQMESPAVLGRAIVTPGTPLRRPIRVSFDATERALALRTSIPLARIVLDSELGRALGRVLAHEIGHVLLGPPHHDLAGLMRASFRAEQLGDPDRTPFRLTCGGVDRLRGRLRAFGADLQRVQRSDSSVGASCIPTPSEP
jgi:hypothetical protein